MPDFRIDLSAFPHSKPLYKRIVAAITREVVTGRSAPGEVLPSMRTLAAALSVSVISVKRAYEELEHDGIISSRQGLGSFVTGAGREKARTSRRREARASLQQALVAARDAGLTKEDLIAWLKR